MGSTAGPPGVETNGKGFVEKEVVVAEDEVVAKLVKEDNNEAEETVEAEAEAEETEADRTEANVEGWGGNETFRGLGTLLFFFGGTMMSGMVPHPWRPATDLMSRTPSKVAMLYASSAVFMFQYFLAPEKVDTTKQ